MKYEIWIGTRPAGFGLHFPPMMIAKMEGKNFADAVRNLLRTPGVRNNCRNDAIHNIQTFKYHPHCVKIFEDAFFDNYEDASIGLTPEETIQDKTGDNFVIL